jgi:MinD-like ATPase involved in chromosome partitioning or flagellar assembly
MSGTVIAVASGKGGVGKTTTVVNVGDWLHADGESVVLVDGDLGMPNLATLLTVDPKVTIHELLTGDADLQGAEATTPDGLAVLGGEGSIDAYAEADPTNFGEVLQALAQTYEYVIVDTGAGLSYESLLPLGLVDEVVLVSSPDESAVHDTERTADFARTVEADIRGVVVTRVRETTNPVEIGETLGTEVLGVIPEDPVVAESTAAGKPLRKFAQDSSVSESYRKLSKVLIREATPEWPEKVRERNTTEPVEEPDDGSPADDFAYHAPCHARNQGLDRQAVELFRELDGVVVEDVGDSCSGISGTYGWKEEKYENSMQIGEDMFEHMHDAAGDVGMTECPTCAMQMEHGTGYEITHPLQLLEEALC